MGSSPIDLTNQRFGNLLVIERHHENGSAGQVRWSCVCDCGNKTVVKSENLRTNDPKRRTRSCGCLRKASVKASNTTHGLVNSDEYKIWKGIKSRCYNEKCNAYADYGYLGIGMSDEWRNSFMTFYNDMGPRPSPNHTVERNENDKGYCKENCRWATRREQANNRTNNLCYQFNGETKTLPEWCHILKLEYRRVYRRLRMGWQFSEAIKPIEHRVFKFDGVDKTLHDWCDLMGLDHDKTYLRILRGENLENILKE